MYNNVHLLSEICEDTATRKLQVPRFQQPLTGFTTVLCQKPELLTYIFAVDSILKVNVYYFSRTYL